MANFAYTPFKADLLKGLFDFDAPNDIRMLLVSTNTTADTDVDAHFIADIGTLDEFDGANYARKALASEAVVQDDPNNRGEFISDAVVWSALGAGTRQIQAAVLYKHVTNDADSVLIAYIDTITGVTFPFNGNGGAFTLTPNAEGWLQTT